MSPHMKVYGHLSQIGELAKIHDALITLSALKLKLYIQSIGFMMPLEHLIEIKCQNAWMPQASDDANQPVDGSNLDSAVMCL